MSRRSQTKDTSQSPCGEEPYYRPVSYSWQTRQCKKLDLPFVRLIELRAPAHLQPLRLHAPFRVRETEGDGNCLFRCFSLVITGSDVHHKHVRNRVVEHIGRNGKTFSALLPGSFKDDASKYLSKSKMDRAGTWGSDVEIMAAAHMLKTRIFVYTIHGDNWQWVEYNLDLTAPTSKIYSESIYLMHTGLVHYDLVEEVESWNRISQQKSVCLKSEDELRSREKQGVKPKFRDSSQMCTGRRVKSKVEQPPSMSSYGNMAFALAADEFEYARWLIARQKALASRNGRRRCLSTEH